MNVVKGDKVIVSTTDSKLFGKTGFYEKPSGKPGNFHWISFNDGLIRQAQLHANDFIKV